MRFCIWGLGRVRAIVDFMVQRLDMDLGDSRLHDSIQLRGLGDSRLYDSDG